MTVTTASGECSGGVAALVAMIAALPYSADFRPYFTIHDRAFQELLATQLPNNSNGLPRLLGVTNLYFLKVRLPFPPPADAAHFHDATSHCLERQPLTCCGLSWMFGFVAVVHSSHVR